MDLDGDVIVRVDESNVAIGIECCNQGITVRAGSTLVPGTYAPFPRPAPAP